jgi:hypothetical protein
VTPQLKPSLTEPYLKTTRAKVHLDALRNSLDAFRKSKPITFRRKKNVKASRYEIKLKIQDTPNEVPLILGDLLYCLRSALDQTVWQLAKLSLPYPEKTQFPILGKDTKQTRATFEVCTAGVPAGAKTLLKELQPYNRVDPKSHLLWRLNLLNIIDKHRRIPMHGDILDFQFPKFPRNLVHLLNLDHENHMVSAPLELKGKMVLNPNISFDIVFGDAAEGISANFDDVTKIYNFVTDSVIPRFSRFFP